jgi:hypothetical protein
MFLEPDAIHASIKSYLQEKHRIGIVEICRVESHYIESGFQYITDAQTHFEVLMPELRRICQEYSVYATSNIVRFLRPGEAQIGSTLHGEILEGRERRIQNLHQPTQFAQYDRLSVKFWTWKLPHFRIRYGPALKGQRDFIDWTDRWWHYE